LLLDGSSSTSDREHFYITASYEEEVKHDPAKAIEDYETLLRLYPDHYWAANNLQSLYMSSGRWDDRWRLAVRVADLRPDSLPVNEIAACGMYLTKNPGGAAPYVKRVRTLAANYPEGPFTDEYVELLPAFYSWSQGDVAAARSQFLELERAHKDFDYPYFLWSIGELDEAEKRLKANASKNEVSDIMLGMGAYLRGDVSGAKRYFEHFHGGGFGWTWFVVMGRSGLWDRVEAGLPGAPSDRSNPGNKVVRGELYVARGRTREGIALLEQGLEGMHTFPVGAFYLGTETLAKAYERQGTLDEALRVLQRASEAKGKAYTCLSSGTSSGQWWLRDELQLADLYRKMGRIQEAGQVENELRKMLVFADPEHPIVVALQHREAIVGQ
jgi:tetratricopeptide (TPR) repeat protein